MVKKFPLPNSRVNRCNTSNLNNLSPPVHVKEHYHTLWTTRPWFLWCTNKAILLKNWAVFFFFSLSGIFSFSQLHQNPVTVRQILSTRVLCTLLKAGLSVLDNFQSQGVNEDFLGVNTCKCGSLQIYHSFCRDRKPALFSGSWPETPYLIWNTARASCLYTLFVEKDGGVNLPGNCRCCWIWAQCCVVRCTVWWSCSL